MNKHTKVPYCEACQVNALAFEKALACPKCGEVIEDFSPPRKLEVAKKRLRWETADGCVRVWFRDMIVARAEARAESRLVATADGPRIEHADAGARYQVDDLPIVQILGIGPPCFCEGFKTLAAASTALRRLIENRLEA